MRALVTQGSNLGLKLTGKKKEKKSNLFDNSKSPFGCWKEQGKGKENDENYSNK